LIAKYRSWDVCGIWVDRPRASYLLSLIHQIFLVTKKPLVTMGSSITITPDARVRHRIGFGDRKGEHRPHLVQDLCSFGDVPLASDFQFVGTAPVPEHAWKVLFDRLAELICMLQPIDINL